MNNSSTIYCTVLYHTAPLLTYLMYLNPNNTYVKFLQCIINTAIKFLCNLASTDYDLTEDDALASKHTGAV